MTFDTETDGHRLTCQDEPMDVSAAKIEAENNPARRGALDVSAAKIAADQIIASVKRLDERQAKEKPPKTNDWQRFLRHVKRIVGDLEVAFRASKTRVSYIRWTIAEDNHGDECLALRLVMLDRANKETVEHHFFAIRRHALARVLQRTGISSLEELAEALPLDWLQIGRYSGALDGDRLTIPMRDGSMLAGEWTFNLRQEELMAVIHTCLLPQLAEQEKWDRKYCRLAAYLLDAEDAPTLPLLYGETITEEQKQTIFHAAEAGRPK